MRSPFKLVHLAGWETSRTRTARGHMALAMLLLAGLVIFTLTGIIVWVAYLLLARAGRFLHRRILVRRSV